MLGSIWKSVLAGAVVALLLVGIAVALVATGTLQRFRTEQANAGGPVIVALVLPDQNGVVKPRVVDLYARSATGWTLRSVDPSMSAVLPGTSATTLADAYSFGGGAGLQAAYASATGTKTSAWVTVDGRGLDSILGSSPVSLTLPSDMEVFDGQQLLSFSAGATDTPAALLPYLMDGVEYLRTAEAMSIREQLGDRLVLGLAKAAVETSAAPRSNLSAAQLYAWMASLRPASRPPK
jgi:hypothetical protein